MNIYKAPNLIISPKRKVYSRGGAEGERGGRRERECVCVCGCIDGYIVECPRSPPPPSVYLALRAND